MISSGLPLSRQGLIVKELDNELLVYDKTSKTAYCLCASSAVIWKMCDGKTAIEQLSIKATRELDRWIDEAAVTFVLARMRKDGLIGSCRGTPVGYGRRLSRVIARLGRVWIAVALGVPLITAILTPTAAKPYFKAQF